MKYIKYLLFLLFSFIPLTTLAYGVRLSCPSIVNPNQTFTCTIYSPSYCSEINMELSLPNGFILKGEKAGKNFKSLSISNNLSYIATGNIDRILSTFEVTAPNTSNKDISIELKNVKYKYMEDDIEYTVTTNIIEGLTFNGTTTDIRNSNYILTLDSNNGTRDMQTLSCTPASGKCEISLLNANVPTKEGYVFKGWGSDYHCQSGVTDNIELTGNTILYACFVSNMEGHLKNITVENYTINFDPNIYSYDLYVSEDEKRVIYFIYWIYSYYYCD